MKYITLKMYDIIKKRRKENDKLGFLINSTFSLFEKKGGLVKVLSEHFY